ncbi:MAG: tetraacyldisaccharide 4'-kinase [Bacteroidales bacterium]|jgi:tetraacyldisaccharide 4'-kinase|nr:tetraacyldisaccharide 4'-kinase [Bacteroidales bacterium]
MIDKILLFPYWLSLKLRHFFYDSGLRKVSSADVPTICIGNITVGGTGKTPHTEMLIRTLLQDEEWGSRSIAVLSRGYKRKTKGFQQVTSDGTALAYGDEPLQIKKKFPGITVAVDKSRTEGCDFLAHPDKLQTTKKGKKCIDKDLPAADLIILDDAFQHRALKPTLSIVLVDYNRPIFKDHLLPMGRLRDLPERIAAADIVIVSKCPNDVNAWEKCTWAENLGIRNFDAASCSGTRRNGKKQHIFFSTITYDAAEAVFPEGNPRYIYTNRLVLFSGIANDAPLLSYLSSDYKIVRHFKFPDHHKFSRADINTIASAAKEFPTSVIMTTEKDCQRIRDCHKIKEELKQRMFYSPIKTAFLTENEKEKFITALKDGLR